VDTIAFSELNVDCPMPGVSASVCILENGLLSNIAVLGCGAIPPEVSWVLLASFAIVSVVAAS
jgi:hypothetical protein